MKLKYHISLNSFILSTIIFFGCTSIDVVPFKATNISEVLIKNEDNSNVKNENNLKLDDKIILEDLIISKRNGKKEDITPTWTSSDETIATIEQVPATPNAGARAGEKWAIVGKKPGTVKVTGEYSFDNAGETKKGVVEKSFTFNFANQPMLTIYNELVNLHKGETHLLNVKYWDDKGQTIDNPSVTWSSSDATKLSVVNTGRLTALANTTTGITITVYFSNPERGINISNSLTINVTEAPTVRKATLMINSHQNTIEVGKTLNLTFAYTKSSGEADTTITPTWLSSDITKATITATGLVTAKNVGEITITIQFTPTDEEQITSTSTLNIIADPIEKKRTGTFPAGAPHNIGGTVELVENTDGSFKLVFQANFKRVGGPDPWLYLNRSAYTTGVPDLEIFNLKNISKLTDDTAEIYEYPLPTSLKISTINEYNHLVIFCKAFGYKFSTAEFSK